MDPALQHWCDGDGKMIELIFKAFFELELNN